MTRNGSALKACLHRAVVLALLMSLVWTAVPLQTGSAAATIVVNSFADAVNNDGLCTLREAIIAANKDMASGRRSGECGAGQGVDTIILPAGTYTLSRTDSGQEDAAATGDLDIASNISIQGAGARDTLIQTVNFTDRIFHILSGNVSISGVTVQGGNVAGDGGGIYNAGQLVLTGSSITANQAGGSGGGLYNAPSGSIEIRETTVHANQAGSFGGGIANAGTAASTNVTISGNQVLDKTSANFGGGGWYNAGGGASLNYVTFSANVANPSAGSGDNLRRAGGTLTLANTLLANPAAGGNCSGALTSSGHNLSSDATCAASLNQPGDLNGQDPLLGPLADNGGGTLTHALLPGSPAVNAAGPAGCPATDQRGVARPQGPACDIGAFEQEAPSDPPQSGPVLTVNTTEDGDDGLCSQAHCSLREAVRTANEQANGTAPDEIHFNLPGSGPFVIQPGAALPVITDPVVIDGASQPGGTVELDGSQAGPGISGLEITAGNSVVSSLLVRSFGAHGILLSGSGNNRIEASTITANAGSGVQVTSGAGNRLQANRIWDNGGLGIDLAGDGPTPNDAGDADSGPNGLQNFPVLTRVIPAGASTGVEGRLNSAPGTTYEIEFYSTSACHPSNFGAGQVFLAETSVTTDSSGDVNFQITLDAALPAGSFVTATASSPDGSTSEFSQCTPAGPGNDSWVRALPLPLSGGGTQQAATDGYLDKIGQSRWYRFSIQPGSSVVVTLTGLPENYDLTLYKDIAAAFSTLNSPQDLLQLNAEFAPDAFSPDAFSPDAFSPDAFSPDAFSPDAFSPDAFSPDAFSPDAFSPDAFSPDAFSPDAFSPDAFSPDAFSPDAFSPDAFSPDAFSPDAFSSAQTRSLIAVSAFDGIVSEGIQVNTWGNTGDFYVRVRGRNGTFSLAAPYHLEIKLLTGSCSPVSADLPASSLPVSSGGYETLILTDMARMEGTPAEKAELQARLVALAGRPEVAGQIVDLGADARVTAANDQADQFLACPYAKNLVAESIQAIIDGYRAANPLEYLVIVGNDDVIPFYRYPDQALLANERNFVPPVRDNTASQASLKLGYVLSQDRYGASHDLSLKDNRLPLPDLAVGRLVETPADVIHQVDTYLTTQGGVAPAPSSALVTGYDFLEDAAHAIAAQLESGLGSSVDTLIAPREISPLDPAAWTAEDLSAALLGSRHDLIFLAGHFSASSALAADYQTRLLSTDLLASPVDLANAVVFSIGCHAGYNIVNPHAVTSVTREPDWAQAFAQKGAVLIAGTGYQYGDTDFIEYSERLYLEFSKALRAGSGPVSVGNALVEAKQAYLAGTPNLTGLHEKSLLEATLFGLPMLSVNLPAGRGGTGGDASIVSGTTAVTTDPGQTLGLSFADVSIQTALTQHQVNLTDPEDGSSVTATYLSGSDGVVTNAAEPVLPLEMRNVTVPGTVLRGIGFRGGAFTELADILPLTGASTTEVRGIHGPFPSNVFFPVVPWNANYLDALARPDEGATQLVLRPAQFKSSSPGSARGTLRAFSRMDFRLYYSSNIQTYSGGSTPALAAAPSILGIGAEPSNGQVNFRVKVAGNPAAGVQAVWVTYSATSGSFAGRWQSLDLAQNAGDSTHWEGSLNLNGTPPEALRFMVQAANGVGLVSLATNLGAFYIPGEPVPGEPTELNLELPTSSGPYGTQATFSAVLTSDGAPLAGRLVTFRLGPQSRSALTNSSGRASVVLELLGLPGAGEARASFAGEPGYAPATASESFTITKQATQISLQPQSAEGYATDAGLLTAVLSDASGRPLDQKTVVFVVSGSEGTYTEPVITDFAGRAVLGDLPLPFGDYTVKAYFSGAIPIPGGGSLTLEDIRYHPSSAAGTLTLLSPPVCSDAQPDPLWIWPPNNSFVPVNVLGVYDPDGDPVSITITSIFQDEPVGTGSASPDGRGIGTSTAEVRSERDGTGDGRVYHIGFRGSNAGGGFCTGVIRVGVSDNQGGGIEPIDDGPLYDSTVSP